MELKNKLKDLRVSNNMTQETVAEQLGVSAQTVSKWERGLRAPDIALLPKIALLFKCSIDSLFNMELVWGDEHKREFEAKIRKLYDNKDKEGIYEAWLKEIELNPDAYENYPEVMTFVLDRRLHGKKYIEKMILLADRAEKYCTNDDIRNEIYRIMLQLCACSEDRDIKRKAKYYYLKLPLLRHSREVYASCVMDGEEHRAQILKNLIYIIGLAECSIHQLIKPEMSLEEKLFYYQKSAELYETVLDSKYAGYYDAPLLSNYVKIAETYVKIGKPDVARNYVKMILETLEKHILDPKSEVKSKLLYSTNAINAAPTEYLCKRLLKDMLNIPELAEFREDILKMQYRYLNRFCEDKSKTKSSKD